MSFLLVVLLPYLIVNAVTFFIARGDKVRAKKGLSRVPESRFIFLSFFLGGTGILLAFHIFRHKTRHYGLLFFVWLGTVLNLAMIAYASWFLFDIGLFYFV